jgi:hypothetical protein
MGHGSYDVPRGLGVALLAALVLLSGCALTSTSAKTSHPQRQHPRVGHGTHHPKHSSKQATPKRAELPRDAATAETELDRLVVRPRPRGTEGYVRAAFGTDWVDTDHDGCNQRDDVLLRDAVPGSTTVAQQGSCDHDVLAGTWHDPYTGKTLTFTDLKDLRQAEAVQIDHIVPLAEAWVSGARRWSPDRRKAFANDLHELLAVDGPTNMSKGDGDPAAWRPRKGYQCAYARRWIGVKARYGLAVDPSEKAALHQMLGYCH